ncbi:hypothetical protein QZH41_004013 [Actinostola sp. cb2023]|nr:hypothetical protein QZH41_004013 [Actinostola sp. cb2023]
MREGIFVKYLESIFTLKMSDKAEPEQATPPLPSFPAAKTSEHGQDDVDKQTYRKPSQSRILKTKEIGEKASVSGFKNMPYLGVCTGPEMIPGSEMIPGPEMIPKVSRLAPK